jgi:SAM-dependent methyltransferase
VVGVDVAEDGLERARAAAAEERLQAEFQFGDAAELPFEDASFDVVASAFGAMFAASHAVAAAELARVCRPGGKLGMTLMPADSRAAAIWTVLRQYDGGGTGDHPAAWSERVDELLGDAFELEVERRDVPREPEQEQPTWEQTLEVFAPLREVAERLPESEVSALRQDFREVEKRFATIPASYVLVLGRRR